MAAGAVIEPEAIAANGWTMYSICQCSGSRKHTYRNPAHPGLDLTWFVRYAQFNITYYGKQGKVANTKISKLDQILKAL